MKTRGDQGVSSLPVHFFIHSTFIEHLVCAERIMLFCLDISRVLINSKLQGPNSL